MSTLPPDVPVPWCEKAFKIQMAILLLAVAVGGPLFVFQRPPQWPGPGPAWLSPVFKFVLGVLAPIVGGGLAIQMFRHILSLFGGGPVAETWIGPPPRANCVIMMFAGVVFAGIGIEVWRPVVSSLTFLGSSIWFFFSLTGFLWARAEARKS